MHLEGARPGGPANAGAGPRIEALGSGLGPCTTALSQTAQEIVLRSYQVAAIDDVRAGFRRGASRVALQAPTGLVTADEARARQSHLLREWRQ